MSCHRTSSGSYVADSLVIYTSIDLSFSMIICLLVYIICIIVLLESPVAYGNNKIMFQTVGIPLGSFLWIIWSTMYGLDFVGQLYVKDGVY